MLTVAKKTQSLSLASDPKGAILKAIGDLGGYHLYFNQVLVATYIRPEKTAGGIIRPQTNVEEDIYQGKVGLVVKKGPNAFVSDETIDFGEQTINIGDWAVYRAGDGWACTINGVGCRVLTDRNVKMRIDDPEGVF